MNKTGSVWRYFDIWLLLAVVLLNIYGILMIRSAITGAPAFVGFEQQQMIWMGIGLIAMFIVASIDYRILTSAHWFIYVGLIALLIVVTLIGTAGNEANRWINLGFFNFQPSELGRVLIPVTLGAFVAARQNRVNSFSNTFITLFTKENYFIAYLYIFDICNINHALVHADITYYFCTLTMY